MLHLKTVNTLWGHLLISCTIWAGIDIFREEGSSWRYPWVFIAERSGGSQHSWRKRYRVTCMLHDSSICMCTSMYQLKLSSRNTHRHVHVYMCVIVRVHVLHACTHAHYLGDGYKCLLLTHRPRGTTMGHQGVQSREQRCTCSYRCSLQRAGLS